MLTTELPPAPSVRESETPAVTPGAAGPVRATRVREWSPGLRRTFYVVSGLLMVQLALFLVWSQVETSRFLLNIDAAQYEQAWYLIAHGVMDPVDSMKAAFFWQDHSVFLFWGAAPLWYVWPHPVTLLWLQDIFAVAAEFVGVLWMGDSIAVASFGAGGERRKAAMLVCGALLFLADPWITWSISNDFHVEVFSVFFVVLAARDFKNGRRRAWLWVLLAMGTGNLAATYLIGLGLSAALAGAAWRRRALVVAALGLGWAEFCSLIHGDLGSAFIGYHYLMPQVGGLRKGSLTSVALGVLKHPGAAVSMVWGYKLSIWADLSSGGFVGALSPWAFGVPLIVMAENALNAIPNYISPNTGYQNFPEYIFVPVGTILVCLALYGSASARRRRAAAVVLVSATLMVCGWGVTWYPSTVSQWLRVPSDAAQVLTQVAAQIPPDAEVIASQGIFGDFSWHRYVYNVTDVVEQIPFNSDDVWFVIAPDVGIEVQSPTNAMALIATVASLPGVQLVRHSAGVWAFHWIRRDPYRALAVRQDATGVPAYASAGSSGSVVTWGGSRQWFVQATHRPGYVVSQDYFDEVTTGTYAATVDLDARGPLNVEVWNATTNQILARASGLVTSGRRQVVSLAFSLTSVSPPSLFTGRLLWRSPPPPTAPGVNVEVRVWTPGSSSADVYGVGVRKVT